MKPMIRLNLHIRESVQTCLYAELAPLQGRTRAERLRHLAALGLLYEQGRRAVPTNNGSEVDGTHALTAEDVSTALGHIGGTSDA